MSEQYGAGNVQHIAEQHLGFEAGRASDGAEMGCGLSKRLLDVGYRTLDVDIISIISVISIRGAKLPRSKCQD